MRLFKYPPGAIVERRDSPVEDGYQPFMVCGYAQLEVGDFYQVRELCADGTTFIIRSLMRERELRG